MITYAYKYIDIDIDIPNRQSRVLKGLGGCIELWPRLIQAYFHSLSANASSRSRQLSRSPVSSRHESSGSSVTNSA